MKRLIYSSDTCKIVKVSGSVCEKVLLENSRGDMELCERFEHESFITSAINHTNSVRFISKSGNYSFYMEFVKGVSLQDLVYHYNYWGFEIPVEVTLYITRAVATLLKFFEEKMYNEKPLNLVHRDICPKNIMLGKTGEVKVIDYGIAKSSALCIDEEETVLGSFPYIAPEQIQCAEVSSRTDVYALGLTLYELLTLRNPLESEKSDIFELEWIQDTRLPLRLNMDYPKRLSALLSSMTQKRMFARPSPQDVIREIDDYAKKEGLELAQSNIKRHLSLHFPQIYNTMRADADTHQGRSKRA